MSDQAYQDNRQFWNGITKLPLEAQHSFWNAGITVSHYISEPPMPKRLQYDFSKPPPEMPWWERLFFHLGQSSYNQAVTAQAQSEVVSDSAKWLWGALQGDFNKSPTTGQIIVGGIISMIPLVDQACDVRDVVANCINLSDAKEREKTENWIALGLTCIGFIPEAGSAVKTVAKAGMRNVDHLVDLIKHMEWFEAHYRKLKVSVPWGHAPFKWLRTYDWQGACKLAGQNAKKAFLSAIAKAEAAAKYAIGLIQLKLKQFIDTLKIIVQRIESVMADLANRIKAKIDDLIKRGKDKLGNYQGTSGTPNKHGQGDKPPPPDKKTKPRLTGVHTEPNTAFFWSGKTNGVGGQDVAATVAKQRGGKTLEMLIEERGIKMPKWDANNPASVKAWQDISEQFAKGVSGEVRGVIGQNVRDKSIWLAKELPALKANPAVTKITTIDPVTLKELVIFKR